MEFRARIESSMNFSSMHPTKMCPNLKVMSWIEICKLHTKIAIIDIAFDSTLYLSNKCMRLLCHFSFISYACLCFTWPFIRMSMWFYQILTSFSLLFARTACVSCNTAKYVAQKQQQQQQFSIPLVTIKQYKRFRHNHGWWHLHCGEKNPSFFS